MGQNFQSLPEIVKKAVALCCCTIDIWLPWLETVLENTDGKNVELNGRTVASQSKNDQQTVAALPNLVSRLREDEKGNRATKLGRRRLRGFSPVSYGPSGSRHIRKIRNEPQKKTYW